MKALQKKGAVSCEFTTKSTATCCYNEFDTENGYTITASRTYCSICVKQADGNWQCSEWVEMPRKSPVTNGQTGLPGQLGTALPQSGNHTGTVTTGPARQGTLLPPGSVFNAAALTITKQHNTGTLSGKHHQTSGHHYGIAAG